jgi:hypothetical protein
VVSHAKGFVCEAIEVAQLAVRRASRLRDPRLGYLYPHLYLGLVLLDADQMAEAEAALQDGRRLAEERGTTLWLPLYHWALGFRRLFAGEWEDGIAEAEAGLGLAEEVGTRLHAPFLHGMQAWVAIQRADLMRAEALLQGGVREFVALADEPWLDVAHQQGLSAAGPQWPVEWGLWNNGLLKEAQGNDAEALSALKLSWQLGTPLRHLLSSRKHGPDVVRVALRMGDRELALAVTEELEDGARRSPFPDDRGRSAPLPRPGRGRYRPAPRRGGRVPDEAPAPSSTRRLSRRRVSASPVLPGAARRSPYLRRPVPASSASAPRQVSLERTLYYAVSVCGTGGHRGVAGRAWGGRV